MSREIKFRAWSTNTKEMFYSGFEINSYGGIAHTYGIYDPKLKLMQYTGLKDKNGKEIYEGDVVIVPDTALKIPLKILWYGTGWHYTMADGEDPLVHPLQPFDGKIVEVIGNIYENPDLLKGGLYEQTST